MMGSWVTVKQKTMVGWNLEYAGASQVEGAPKASVKIQNSSSKVLEFFSNKTGLS